MTHLCKFKSKHNFYMLLAILPRNVPSVYLDPVLLRSLNSKVLIKTECPGLFLLSSLYCSFFQHWQCNLLESIY
jgi:hypothetical protein